MFQTGFQVFIEWFHCRVLSLVRFCPPLPFLPFIAYTMAKYGMSMCVLGMAEELKSDGIAVNALWPRTGEDHHLVYTHVASFPGLFNEPGNETSGDDAQLC